MNSFDINKFFKVIEELRESIDSVKSSRYNSLFKCILYMPLIDLLAKTCFPDDSVGKRFKNFVAKFADWPEHKRISLPHLQALLRRRPEPIYSQLRGYVETKLSSWDSGSMIKLTRDAEKSEIVKIIKSDRIRKTKIDKLSHRELLWTYRNFLVHEFRKLGEGVEDLFGGDEAHYHERSKIKIKDGKSASSESWQLVYPLGFLKKIVTNSIKNLRGYYEKNSINPYDFVLYGEFWIDELRTSGVSD